MKKSKPVKRVWIPGKKGKRGHFSACKRGHPWRGEVTCGECRKARDAARTSTKEYKTMNADRKRRDRWDSSPNKTTHYLPDGYKVEILRGSILIDSKSSRIILNPEQTAKLYEVIRDDIATNYPSKLPKAFRAVKPQGNLVCGSCEVMGSIDQLNRADFHKPGCSEREYCTVKAY